MKLLLSLGVLAFCSVHAESLFPAALECEGTSDGMDLVYLKAEGNTIRVRTPESDPSQPESWETIYDATHVCGVEGDPSPFVCGFAEESVGAQGLKKDLSCTRNGVETVRGAIFLNTARETGKLRCSVAGRTNFDITFEHCAW